MKNVISNDMNATQFAQSLNLSAPELEQLKSLTDDQLRAIRQNVRVDTDQEALDAAAQYMADGGSIADLCERK